MGPAPLTYATAKYRGVRSETPPPFDPRSPVECAGLHLTAEFAVDLVPLYGRTCEVERWQPRCQACLDEGPPFGLFRCSGCDHEHEVGDWPKHDLVFRGQHLCVACATAVTLADPRFWVTRAAQLNDERCQLPAYVDVVVARRLRIKILESWWLDVSAGRVLLPSTPHLVTPRPRTTISFGSLCEIAHRRAAEALKRWPSVGWAVTAISDYWIVWSLIVREASRTEILAASCTSAAMSAG